MDNMCAINDHLFGRGLVGHNKGEISRRKQRKRKSENGHFWVGKLAEEFMFIRELQRSAFTVVTGLAIS